nr:translation initiation factor IF-2-like isoform X2 [Symphalangus syndactylus]
MAALEVALEGPGSFPGQVASSLTLPSPSLAPPRLSPALRGCFPLHCPGAPRSDGDSQPGGHGALHQVEQEPGLPVTAAGPAAEGPHLCSQDPSVGMAPAGSCDLGQCLPTLLSGSRGPAPAQNKAIPQQTKDALDWGTAGELRGGWRGSSPRAKPQNHRASCKEDACPTQSLARAPLGLRTPKLGPRLGGGGWSGDTAWEGASSDVHQDHGWGATGSKDCPGQERRGWWGSERPPIPQAQASLGWGCGSCLGRHGDPRRPSLQVLLCSDGRGGLPAILGETQAMGASGLDAGLGTVRGSWLE